MGCCGRRMNVALNGKLFEDVKLLKYFRSKITVDGGLKTEGKSGINNVGKMLEEMK